MRVLVTGGQGFIGSNLVSWLRERTAYAVDVFDRDRQAEEFAQAVLAADTIIHLAGINRPQHPEEFQTGNVGLTAEICRLLQAAGRSTTILFASSTQAELDNPYGSSKRQAEALLSDHARQHGTRVVIFRLANVFGKWCRPNYNSVVATFCYNIARDLPITISDPEYTVPFVYIDDVIRAMLVELAGVAPGIHSCAPGPVYPVTLGQLADLLYTFRQSRQSLQIPDFSDAFSHKLYSTFLSYLPADDFGYHLTQRSDARGSLAEFVKSPTFGQIFISRTRPGITRGNHFHHLKTEKFLVLEGQAIIRFRTIRPGAAGEQTPPVIEYQVSGDEYRVLDIPPGYTHSIENVGPGTLVTLFWASEIFDPERPDTTMASVL